MVTVGGEGCFLLMNKSFILLGVGILILGAIVGFVLYTTEVQRNNFLRSENSKTIEEAQTEIKKIKTDLKSERDKNLDDKKKLLDQETEATKKKLKPARRSQKFLFIHPVSFISDEGFCFCQAEGSCSDRAELPGCHYSG